MEYHYSHPQPHPHHQHGDGGYYAQYPSLKHRNSSISTTSSSGADTIAGAAAAAAAASASAASNHPMMIHPDRPFYYSPSAANCTILNDQDQYPTPKDFHAIVEEYLQNLSSKKRDKALVGRKRYSLILQVLKDPRNTAISTAQFRFWVKKMFQLAPIETADIVCHDNKPVAMREQIYDILVRAHREAHHGGRDKTSALVRRRYSWIPKELIARFVRHCPFCISRRNGCQSPTISGDGGGMPKTPPAYELTTRTPPIAFMPLDVKPVLNEDGTFVMQKNCRKNAYEGWQQPPSMTHSYYHSSAAAATTTTMPHPLSMPSQLPNPGSCAVASSSTCSSSSFLGPSTPSSPFDTSSFYYAQQSANHEPSSMNFAPSSFNGCYLPDYTSSSYPNTMLHKRTDLPFSDQPEEYQSSASSCSSVAITPPPATELPQSQKAATDVPYPSISSSTSSSSASSPPANANAYYYMQDQSSTMPFGDFMMDKFASDGRQDVASAAAAAAAAAMVAASTTPSNGSTMQSYTLTHMPITNTHCVPQSPSGSSASSITSASGPLDLPSNAYSFVSLSNQHYQQSMDGSSSLPVTNEQSLNLLSHQPHIL